MEDRAASHTTSRNTGVIHRPFYMNPKTKKVFAAAAQKSYYLWSRLANGANLPWSQVGTLELATRQGDVDTLNQYKGWAVENGMEENEVEIVSPNGAKKVETDVNSLGGIFSKTDTSVDFGNFSSALLNLATEKRNKLSLASQGIGNQGNGKWSRTHGQR